MPTQERRDGSWVRVWRLALVAAALLAASSEAAAEIVYQNNFETAGGPLPNFSIAGSHGVRCEMVGRDSACAYGNVVMDNDALPPYPEVRFPRQTGTLFVRFDLKTPENFYLGRGAHGYYLYDSADRANGMVVIDPHPEGGVLSHLERDEYTKVILRGSGYHRMSTSFEGFKPRRRGEWHSYQLMIVPSNKDPSVGRLKLWIDGELANFAKTDTVPAYDTFWISNYWHSLIYVPQDDPNYGNLHEAQTAPLHPAFELLLDNLTVATEFVESGAERYQIERVRYSGFAAGAFTVNFDTTVRATAKVEWGETAAYGNESQGAAGYFHALNVAGLAPNRTYYLRLSAVDATGRTISSAFTFTTDAGNTVPVFTFPEWKAEVYQNLDLSGAPVLVRSVKDLDHVSWSPQDSDDLVRTDQPMSVRYSKQQHFSAGSYSFKVGAYDGIRVLVDGDTRINATARTNGYNRRRDFNLALAEGLHDITVEHIIYRYDDWERTNSKFVNFAIEPQDQSAPRLLTHAIYNLPTYLPDQPFFAGRCDEDCRVVIDYGADISYGQQLVATGGDGVGTAVSPRPAARFPALTPGATYHYRLTLSDNLGNTRVLPDRTFTVGDTIPPRKIANLRAVRLSPTSLRLTFRAPGEDSKHGTAAQYDLRYTVDAPLTIQNWESATRVANLPAPQSGGSAETLTLDGFPAGPTYYFGIKAIDDNGQPALLSNIAAAPAAAEIMDLDGDGYGVGSALGPDCDDYDVSVAHVSDALATGYCVGHRAAVAVDATPPAAPSNLTVQ